MNLQNVPILSILLLIFFIQGCASGQKDNSSGDLAVRPGETNVSVPCKVDTAEKYALFLPATYTEDKKWPVLICFDSHADGLLPVNLFREEAGKNGFIVAGSNHSKNGMATQETTAIFRKVLADLQDRFTVDNTAVYVAGFSGGSRVASAAAITEGTVAGVVGCGAGFPNINQQPKNPFSYLGVAGAQDFNYTEMRQLDEMLENAGFVHHFLVFDGIHQWPLPQVVPDIFTWLAFDRMRKGSSPHDRAAINSFIDLNSGKAEQLGKNGDKKGELEVFIKMKHYLQGLTDISPLDAEISDLEKDPSVIRQKALQQALFEKESSLQSQYGGEVQQKGIEWWKTEAAKLHSLADKQPATDETRMYKRVLGYLSLTAYMASNSALKQEDYGLAARFVEIYRLIDPTNAEHRYMAAIINARQGNADTAFRQLDQAIELGFKDFKRLKSDPQLKSLQSDQRFVNLVKGH